MIWGHISSFQNLFQTNAWSMMSTPVSVDKLTEVTMEGVFFKMLEAVWHRHQQPSLTPERNLQDDLHTEYSLAQHLPPSSFQVTQALGCHQPFPIHPASQKHLAVVSKTEYHLKGTGRCWCLVPFLLCGSLPKKIRELSEALPSSRNHEIIFHE